MIAVNTGFGDPYSAGQWVEYCNGITATTAGAWRARNGHAKPYGVQYWCVGNEMFGPWQLGFMQLSQYRIKHNLVAAAMWKVDPSIGSPPSATSTRSTPTTTRSRPERHLLVEGHAPNCADSMNFISEHFYEGRTPWATGGRDDLLTHVTKLKMAIRHKARGHRALQASLPNLKGRIVPIAMDEWNYWHREYVYGELGCVYDQADALGVAEGLHEYFRQSDIIQMAFYAQTVNVIGAIKTTRTAAELETTGLVLQLYRAHFGQIPLRLPATLTRSMSRQRSPPTAVRSRLPSSTRPPRPWKCRSTRRASRRGPATRWLLAAADEQAHNTPGQPSQVDLTRPEGLDASRPLSVPALGVALFVIPLARG